MTIEARRRRAARHAVKRRELIVRARVVALIRARVAGRFQLHTRIETMHQQIAELVRRTRAHVLDIVGRVCRSRDTLEVRDAGRDDRRRAVMFVRVDRARIERTVFVAGLEAQGATGREVRRIAQTHHRADCEAGKAG